MRSLPWLAIWFFPAMAFGCPATPSPVVLPVETEATDAMLFHPQGWEPGDAGVVLQDEVAFRSGCDSLALTVLMEGGAMVLVMRPAAWQRVAAGLGVLRRAYGAGLVVALRAVAEAGCGPAFAHRPGRACVAPTESG